MSTTMTTTTALLETRLDGVRRRITAEGWAGLLVLDLVDIGYLTGLQSTNAALLVTPTSAVVVTDFRYLEKAASLNLDVRRVEQSLYGDLGQVIGNVVGSGAVGYSPGSLSHLNFLKLTEGLADGVMLRSVDGVVAGLRQVKVSVELDAIRRAASLLDEAYAEVVVGGGLVGRTEREVAWAIERFLREHGADGLAFDSIVAGGTNGASPHHTCSDEPIPTDTLVTVDIGCVVDGYCSDCTRTFAVGEPGERLLEIYDVTLRAQEAALAAIRPGASSRAVDAVARDLITEAGYGDCFGHGLGHGVGREIHEGPRLTRTTDEPLQVGNVVTVEPGIYVAGVGGVRIEDLVIVTSDGCDILTNFPKQLTTVG